MNDPTQAARTFARIGTFIVLVLIGLGYLASLGYFMAKGSNFAFRQMTAAATRFAKSTTLTLPTEISFTGPSPWLPALATGWNRPSTVPLWSSHRNATMVLPALADHAVDTICMSATVASMGQNHHWPMLVTVNGQPLAPRETFAGAVPATIRGTVHVEPGALLQVQFAGPKPLIPQLITRHSGDARRLGFELLKMTITARCDAAEHSTP